MVIYFASFASFASFVSLIFFFLHWLLRKHLYIYYILPVNIGVFSKPHTPEARLSGQALQGFTELRHMNNVVAQYLRTNIDHNRILFLIYILHYQDSLLYNIDTVQLYYYGLLRRNKSKYFLISKYLNFNPF